VPYRNVMTLAMEEINAKGGLLSGRKLKIIFRDDGGTPGDAATWRNSFWTGEKLAFLVGTFLSRLKLLISTFPAHAPE
jgi:branched-chain amino acid transport system substrate-binding protein